MEMKHFVVTIGREYGSKGAEIGKKLAEALGVNYYDRDLVYNAAKKLGIEADLINEVDETISKKTSGFDKAYGVDHTYLSNKLIEAQSSIIANVADTESCIIVGRCANYVLRDRTDCINVLIYAPFDIRVSNIMEYGMSKKEAEKMVEKVDKKRRDYYLHVTGRERNELHDRQFMFDSNILGIDGTVEELKNIIIKLHGKKA